MPLPLETRNDYLEKLRELGEHVIADELAQAVNRWDDWLKGHRPPLIERYLQWKTGFHVHAKVVDGIEPDQRVPHEYCVWFYYPDCGPEIRPMTRNQFGFLLVDNRESDGCAGLSSGVGGKRERDARGQLPVLIDAIQFMDLPEGVIPKVLPSEVGLQRLDDCGWRLGNAPDFLPLFLGAHGPVEEDGKLGALFLLSGHCAVVEAKHVGLSERKRKMIQGASEIVSTVTDHQGDVVRHGIDSRHSESTVLPSGVFQLLRSGLRIYFIDEVVRLFCDPRLLASAKLIEVCACPVELQRE